LFENHFQARDDADQDKQAGERAGNIRDGRDCRENDYSDLLRLAELSKLP
jgi:hypothetical protein